MLMLSVVNIVLTSGLSHLRALLTQQVFQRCTMKLPLNLVFAIFVNIFKPILQYLQNRLATKRWRITHFEAASVV